MYSAPSYESTRVGWEPNQARRLCHPRLDVGRRDHLSGDRHEVRAEHEPVSCQKWNAMNDTCSRDQLIGRIPAEIEFSRRDCDGKINRPYVHGRQRILDGGTLEIDLDPPQLEEFRQLPKDDRRNAPTVAGEELPLSGSNVALKGVDQDVGIKI
jgi:hypothetical protein